MPEPILYIIASLLAAQSAILLVLSNRVTAIETTIKILLIPQHQNGEQ